MSPLKNNFILLMVDLNKPFTEASRGLRFTSPVWHYCIDPVWHYCINPVWHSFA
jgi:hypothetical protein